MAFSSSSYDYKFCDPLPDECPCPVCTLVQKDPHQLTCCGKIFCKSCLDELIKRDQSCPNCRSDFIKGKTYFPDTNTEKKIMHLRVHCKNKGCEWIGCLKDLKKIHLPTCHHDASAADRLVRCTNSNGKCGTLVKQSDLQKHLTTECEWREIACTHCKRIGTFHHIKGRHVYRCLDIPVACSNDGCEEKIKRSQLDSHSAYECPHKIITCRYSSVGCSNRIKKKDIESHNKEYMEEHLKGAMRKIQKLKNERKRQTEDVSCDDSYHGSSYLHKDRYGSRDNEDDYYHNDYFDSDDSDEY